MRRLLTAVTVLFLAACSGDAPTIPSDHVVDLVLDTDSIIFVQGGVDLTESLYAVTVSGDTIYNPDGVSLTLPDGFTRDETTLGATREAAGTVVARLNPSNSTYIRAVQHFDSLAPWRNTASCYDLDGQRRRSSDGEMHSIDSIFSRATVDSVLYLELDRRPSLAGFGALRNVVHWDDGQVDTTTHDSPIGVLAATHTGIDTITLAIGDGVPVSVVADSPRRYHHPPTDSGGPCQAGDVWARGGEWILEQS